MAIKKISLYILVLPIALVLVIPTVSAIWCDILYPTPENCALGDTCSAGYSCVMLYENGQYKCGCRPTEGTCHSSFLCRGGCMWGHQCISGSGCECDPCQTSYLECFDYDFGLDYYTDSYARDRAIDCLGKVKETTYTDSCQTYPDGLTRIHESFCNNGQVFSQVGPCPGNVGCDGDVCLWPYCSDNTYVRTCSITKPLYCTEEAELVYDCDTCECQNPEGQTCIDNVCRNNCIDGTLWGQCSEVTIGKYCDENSVLVDACGAPRNCGCAEGYTCVSGTGECKHNCAGGINHAAPV